MSRRVENNIPNNPPEYNKGDIVPISLHYPGGTSPVGYRAKHCPYQEGKILGVQVFRKNNAVAYTLKVRCGGCDFVETQFK